MFFTRVCHYVHRGGGGGEVCLSACWDTTPPSPEQTPHPTEQAPPPPGACNPPQADTPQAVHAERYGQQAGGMHPTGMQSCL